jgi:hypothetical protein
MTKTLPVAVFHESPKDWAEMSKGAKLTRQQKPLQTQRARTAMLGLLHSCGWLPSIGSDSNLDGTVCQFDRGAIPERQVPEAFK